MTWWFALLALAACNDSSNGDKSAGPSHSNRADSGSSDGGPARDAGASSSDAGDGGGAIARDGGGSGGTGASNGGGSGGTGAGDGGAAQSETCAAPKPCDVTKSACRTAVLELTACVRGSKVPAALPVRSITSDQLRTELQARADKLGLQAGPWDTALIRLGLLAPGTTSVAQTIEQEVQSVTAFYEHDPQRVTLIEAAMPAGKREQMNLLAHEYAHYMQDLEVGLDKVRKRFAKSSDASTAGSALVEGEAVVTATLARARIDGTKLGAIDWHGMTDAMLSDMLVHVAASDGALHAADETLPYPVGIRYVADVWNGWDRAHVDALFGSAPMSLIDWIHGYGDGKLAPSQLEKLECGAPAAPDGFAAWASDSLGAAGALAVLAITAGNSDTTESDFALIGKLRGDMLAVYAMSAGKDAPPSPVVLAWRLRFADAKAATAFEARAAMLQLTTKTFDKEVLLTAGDQANPLTGSALDACPKPQARMRPPSTDLLAAARGGEH